MLIHEFILCAELPEKINYTSYRKRADLVKISDDFILDYHIPIRKVKTYCEDFVNKVSGLDYYGTTIITSEMASELKKN